MPLDIETSSQKLSRLQCTYQILKFTNWWIRGIWKAR